MRLIVDFSQRDICVIEVTLQESKGLLTGTNPAATFTAKKLADIAKDIETREHTQQASHTTILGVPSRVVG